MKVQKPTIVFIHYFGGDGGSWQWLARRLRNKFTCISLTLPGFDNTTSLENLDVPSFADWINTQINLLELKEYILCGHSMGGKLALYAAQINKDFPPAKVILIAPSPPTKEEMSPEEKMRMLHHPNTEEARKTVKKSTRKILRRAKFKYAVESQLRIESSTWKWWINEGMNEDISLITKTNQFPVFVICSKKDPVITLDVIKSEVLPNLQLVTLLTLGKSGHLIPLENTRLLARHIKRIGNT
ncbi:alpha/beta hydrolase [Aquimarina addita]|uniref:Alpha/beta hydrolase n=1 Tax=Aquimarina addita TaxID=870485 RepID=A0ABP6UUT9_9FLAO